MYFYTGFWSINPIECAKLIVGIVGIDGKKFFGVLRHLRRLLSKMRRLFSEKRGLLSKFWRLHIQFSYS